ncbi:unnamed protein product [Lathyrus sativus]|nr:unnamed protein product [Lathyrus sativus]
MVRLRCVSYVYHTRTGTQYILDIDTLVKLEYPCFTDLNIKNPHYKNILTLTLIGRILGGASFNPSSIISFYTLGLRPDSSLLLMAIRILAQAISGAIGTKSILHVMPNEYLHMVKGPSLKVDLYTKAIVEGVLSFTHNYVILIVLFKGPKNPWLKVYLLSMATLVLVVLGYAGPSLNPAKAFGWTYMNNKHNNREQFYVFWICPLIGATRFVFMSSIKEKKA